MRKPKENLAQELEPAIEQIKTAMEYIRVAILTFLGDSESTEPIAELGLILDELDNVLLYVEDRGPDVTE